MDNADIHESAIGRLVAAARKRLRGVVWPANCRATGRAQRGSVAQILFDHAGASGTILACELANEAQRA